MSTLKKDNSEAVCYPSPHRRATPGDPEAISDLGLPVVTTSTGVETSNSSAEVLSGQPHTAVTKSKEKTGPRPAFLLQDGLAAVPPSLWKSFNV